MNHELTGKLNDREAVAQLSEEIEKQESLDEDCIVAEDDEEIARADGDTTHEEALA